MPVFRHQSMLECLIYVLGGPLTVVQYSGVLLWLLRSADAEASGASWWRNWKMWSATGAMMRLGEMQTTWALLEVNLPPTQFGAVNMGAHQKPGHADGSSDSIYLHMYILY